MATGDWLVGDRHAAAAERIYAAATELIARDGIEAFDIAALEERVHCSRATIYRHVGGKTKIRDAVLARNAERIIEAVRSAVDGLSGPDRVVTAVTVALERIRTDPLGQAMVTSMRGAADLAWITDSPLPTALAVELAGYAEDDTQAGQWVVRVVLSLVYWPVADPAAEREMLRRFLNPDSTAPRREAPPSQRV
ncbi:putative HTH-type transcriptional regulator [Mycolicibacterium vanbaalenii]|uniref:Putative HTH-type transcriptional regulator n=1 Tax=Mycolicibacterium vanbaalenii TaxID=110539 RepID=A0A5S9RA17_MYCVN|nr:TetR/AcrR family transcriptional regulator [Mycolicibacterium vanbaalenii]CAA0136385.1 putative HTH-type transcriptional regulator [Mycolicibacterium vanbaalenii]